MINEHSLWRIEIAQKIAPIYAAIPAVRAVVLIGGVARGSGDHYSDIDLAVFWDHAPTEAERRAAVGKFEGVLGTPVIIGGFAAIPVFDSSDSGILWEDFAVISGDPKSGLKIDVNHRTVGAMTRILDDVLIHHDTHGHKLEVMYSIRQVLVLHGENLVTAWQMRAAEYPDALVYKLVMMHLSQLSADLAPHVYRRDWLMYYQTVTSAAYHLVAALLALNRIYEPALKRLRDLCDEMKIKPQNLADRLDNILRGEPEQAGEIFDLLAAEVFALVEANLMDVQAMREKFYARRVFIPREID